MVAYNLELFGGRFHDDTWFALAWGAFPAFTGYFANALADPPGRGAGGRWHATLLSVAQRRLSTPARELRRRTAALTGTQTLTHRGDALAGRARASPSRSSARSRPYGRRSCCWRSALSQPGSRPLRRLDPRTWR